MLWLLKQNSHVLRGFEWAVLDLNQRPRDYEYPYLDVYSFR